jgi:hypothetical protein
MIQWAESVIMRDDIEGHILKDRGVTFNHVMRSS